LAIYGFLELFAAPSAPDVTCSHHPVFFKILSPLDNIGIRVGPMVAFWSTLVESRKDFLVEEISDSSCVEQFMLIGAIKTLIPRLKAGGVSFRNDASSSLAGILKNFHRNFSTLPFLK
jgi:hypothetical protein